MPSRSVPCTEAPEASEIGKQMRGAEIDSAIAAAVRKILVEGGYDALTFDAIAREAGVSRPTLYRRWPNKAKLLENFTYAGDDRLPSAVGSADLGAAIMDILRKVAQHYMAPGMRTATLGAMASRPSDAAFPSRSAREAENSARADVAALVEDAIGKGLMRRDVNAQAFYDLCVGPILYRTLFSSQGEIDEFHLASLLDVIIRGVSAD